MIPAITPIPKLLYFRMKLQNKKFKDLCKTKMLPNYTNDLMKEWSLELLVSYIVTFGTRPKAFCKIVPKWSVQDQVTRSGLLDILVVST